MVNREKDSDEGRGLFYRITGMKFKKQRKDGCTVLGKISYLFDIKNNSPREAVKILLLEAFENRLDDALKIILQGVNCSLVQGVD